MMNTKLLAVVTPPSIYRGCSTVKTFWEKKLINDVIADKKVVTKIMNNSTCLQRIELNGFAKRHLANCLLPLFIWLLFRPVLRPGLVPVV